jgi:hypothetical protein
VSTADGSVVGTVKVVDHGPLERRFNIVVLGDGFQAAELPAFRKLVDDLIDELRIFEPTRQFWPLVNIFRVDVASLDSGIDHPSTGVFRRTFFDGRATGRPREIRSDERLVHRICRQQVSQYHFPVLIMNDAGDFGTGAGEVAALSRGAPGISRVTIHELGHSAFALDDEYDEAGDPSGYFGAEPSAVNVTKVQAPASVKWRSFRPTPLPFVANPDCSKVSANEGGLPAGEVGIVVGAGHFHCGLHRPSGRCRMRSDADKMCPVCLDKTQKSLRRFRPLAIERSRFAMVPEGVLATALNLPAGPHVLVYATGRGEAALLRVAPDATNLTNVLVQQLTLGWTSIVPLSLTGGAHLLLHDAMTGRTEISKVAANGSAITTVFPMRWSTGWTNMTSLTMGGRAYLFSYKALSGRAAIDEIASDGTGTLTMFDAPIELGFTDFAAIERFNPLNPPVAPGGALLAGYNGTTGDVVLFLVGERGASVKEVQRLRTMPFASAFVPMRARHEFLFALYNAVSGDVRWVFANDVGIELIVPPPADSFALIELGTAAWGMLWTTLAPFELNGQTHWFAHRASDGAAVLDRVD